MSLYDILPFSCFIWTKILLNNCDKIVLTEAFMRQSCVRAPGDAEQTCDHVQLLAFGPRLINQKL